jgi:hypothetical protein
MKPEAIRSIFIIVWKNIKRACLTISPQGKLHEAITTATSFLEYNQKIDYIILVTDQIDLMELQSNYPSITFISTSFLEEKILMTMRENYSTMEFAYAMTPFAIKHLLQTTYGQVLFLKLETLVLGDLGPLFTKLDVHSAIVTPHLLSPNATPANISQEIDVLLAGVFNGGVVGFSNTPEALTYLAWWSEKTESQCFLDVSDGLHYEQRWLDFMPSFVSRLSIIRSKGVNVAHWNLHERDLQMQDGLLFAGSEKCLVFRFSGFDETNPVNLTRYKPNLSGKDLSAASSVFEKYKRELRRHKALLGG